MSQGKEVTSEQRKEGEKEMISKMFMARILLALRAPDVKVLE